MSRRVVTVNGTPIILAMEDPTPLGERFWALVRARVIDELTGRAPLATIGVETDTPHAAPRIATDGLVGLVGIPSHVFQPRALAGYPVRLTVQIAGYVPRRVEAAIPDDRRTIALLAPQGATVITLSSIARLRPGATLRVGPTGPDMVSVQIQGLGPGANQVTVSAVGSTGQVGLPRAYAAGDPVFPIVPDSFSPADLGILKIHREPTVIHGRVMRAAAGTITPLAGATVRVAGIWRTPPPANVIVAPDPPNFVSVRPPLYANRASGTGRLRRRNLPAVPDLLTQEKRLVDHVPAGSDRLHLSNRIGLSTVSPGQVLLIDAENPDRQEFIEILTPIVVGSTPEQIAEITLRHPLVYPHARNALAQRVNPQPEPAQKQLVPDPLPGEPDALAGDTTLFLNNLTGLNTGNQVRIRGGGIPDEFHHLDLFTTTSDAGGYYRLPPISRVAQLALHATQGVLTPVDVEFRPDYSVRENRLDLTFR